MTTAAHDSSFRRLLGHARPHRGTLAAGAALITAGALTELAQPLVAKSVVDALAVGDSMLRPVLLLALLVLGGAIVGAFGRFLMERAAEGVVLTARRGLVDRLLRLRVDSLDRQQPGDLVSRVTADTTLLRSAATSHLVEVGVGAVSLVGMLVLMARLDPVLFLVVLGVVVLIGCCSLLVMPRIGRAGRQTQEALGELGAGLERVLGAFRTVKAAGAEDHEAAALNAAAERAWRRGVLAARWGAVAGVAGGLAIQLSFLSVLGVGGSRVADGTLPVSSLIAFLLYLFYLAAPIHQLVSGITGLQIGMAAVRRTGELEDMPQEPTRAPSTRGRAGTDDGTRGGGAAVRFRDVAFRYDETGPAVLDGLSFDVPPNGLTAVVGPSGVGKSTLFALLERFYEADAGSIEVDGRDVRDWPLPELRRTIGLVEQDAPVLAGTLRDNLLLAASDATEEEIGDAVRLARLTTLVDRLPNGLDTPVGHRGTTLSGGQRQRVAIARALLRRPRLLLLDEATSQLDALSELELRDAVADISRTTTVLVVAHRLSTVVGARRILVLEQGRVRASGTHEDLARTDDLYRALASTQMLGPGALHRAPAGHSV
ncbi:ABC transporter ATP-binding protein [Streptomyces sp. M92]|uniref:ABC transporter ATP-binding protein n=1 Tax=Streptomyces sp. M92 TaxID=2944250 RepID=UPI00234B0B65|nr:ABC transporter ATP-binding protein [Streptomyces sp. M92]WCN02199.1 ABC transporter ATP-binding protein/permease [Streptomyces sp. M92]